MMSYNKQYGEQDAKITVALVDDHVLLRKGLASLLIQKGYEVLIQADNGQDFMDKCRDGQIPQVLLLDISMPVMDGYQTAQWAKTHYPEMKILALSVFEDEHAIIRMLHNGARGYLLKDSEPEELKTAIDTIVARGFYHSELVSSKLIHSVQGSRNHPEGMDLTEKEMQFLKWSVSEMTYKEIAVKMGLSPRTVDGYRDALFEKLGIRSRVGLAIYAIRHRLVQV
jgi:DNA-binding NarL/FixJ family response regulator